MQKPLRKIHFTDFGLVVHNFCAETLTSKKELAAEADVPYDTLMQICKGRTAGHEAIPRIEEAMERIRKGCRTA